MEIGWPDKTEEELKPYFIRKEELSVEKGTIMWGFRMLIPDSIIIITNGRKEQWRKF